MMKVITNERELILSDALICAVLQIEAAAVGVTLEDYVDRFLEVFRSDAQVLYPILEKKRK